MRGIYVVLRLLLAIGELLRLITRLPRKKMPLDDAVKAVKVPPASVEGKDTRHVNNRIKSHSTASEDEVNKRLDELERILIEDAEVPLEEAVK